MEITSWWKHCPCPRNLLCVSLIIIMLSCFLQLRTTAATTRITPVRFFTPLTSSLLLSRSPLTAGSGLAGPSVKFTSLDVSAKSLTPRHLPPSSKDSTITTPMTTSDFYKDTSQDSHEKILQLRNDVLNRLKKFRREKRALENASRPKSLVTEGFSALGVSKTIVDALTANGYVKPTQVQANVIPQLLAKESVVIASSTGSGKTLGFLIPIIQALTTQVCIIRLFVWLI